MSLPIETLLVEMQSCIDEAINDLQECSRGEWLNETDEDSYTLSYDESILSVESLKTRKVDRYKLTIELVKE